MSRTWCRLDDMSHKYLFSSFSKHKYENCSKKDSFISHFISHLLSSAIARVLVTYYGEANFHDDLFLFQNYENKKKLSMQVKK